MYARANDYGISRQKYKKFLDKQVSNAHIINVTTNIERQFGRAPKNNEEYGILEH